MKTIKTCSQHPTCSASDSYLPLCKCWCAECKDYMKAVRKAFKLSGGMRISQLAKSATASSQLFTNEGTLRAGN
jgi:hypothetical protein